jgi:hypothetical protein
MHTNPTDAVLFHVLMSPVESYATPEKKRTFHNAASLSIYTDCDVQWHDVDNWRFECAPTWDRNASAIFRNGVPGAASCDVARHIKACGTITPWLS